MQLLYVDRIQNKVYPDRRVPTFKGWTEQLLRDRQTEDITEKKFGQGDLLLQPSDKGKENADDEEMNQGNVQQDDHGASDEEEGGETGEGERRKADGRRRVSKRRPQRALSDTDSGGEDMEEVS